MHGIERLRRLPGEIPEQDQGISRVVVRYADGRVLNFVPDAGRPIFNEDDVLELEKVVIRAAAVAEWAHISDAVGG